MPPEHAQVGQIETNEVTFLTVDDIKVLHALVIAQATPDESTYIRDHGLLEAAAMAPQVTWGDVYLHTTLAAMASALLYSLAQNHAAENGNKRLAFTAASTFLRANGYRLTLTQDEAVTLTMNVVNHVWNQQQATEVIEASIEQM